MRIHPSPHSITRTRVIDHRSRFELAVTVESAFVLGVAPRLADLFAASAPDPTATPDPHPIDEGVPKPRAEVLVAGAVYAPPVPPASSPAAPGRAQPPPAPCRALEAEVVLGSVHKVLRAVGERAWEGQGNGRVPGPPRPFERLPLSWGLAAGGPEDPRNLDGRSDTPPSFELPPGACGGRPPWLVPAGLGPLSPEWSPRKERLGTFGKDWLEKTYPALPADADQRFYNVAPDDQQQPGFWEGEEDYRLAHLHPEQVELVGRLPGVQARVFAAREGAAELVELSMRLTTVCFEPDEDRLRLLFQGSLDVRDEGASDVAEVISGLEWKQDPKPARHYAEVLAERNDPDASGLAWLRDRDLLPEGLLPPGPPKKKEKRGQLQLNMARAHAEKMSQLRQVLADELGVEVPASAMGPSVEELEQKWSDLLEDPSKLEAELDDPWLKQGKEGLEKKLAEGKRALRQRFAEEGIPLDEAAMRPRPSAPPIMGEPGEMPKKRPVKTRADVERALLGEASVEGMDLSEVDLSGLALCGLSLRGAWLAGANLSGADLRDADLSDACLEGSRLVGTDLRGACLVKADLSESDCRDALLSGADATSARFMKADLRRARFDRLQLQDADLLQVVVGARDELPDFRGMLARGTVWSELDLTGAQFEGADLSEATFMSVKLDGANLASAKLEGTTLFESSLDDVDLTSACLKNVRAVGGTTLRKAQMAGVDLERACLRGVPLTGVELSGARLSGADFSGADLTLARLTSGRGRSALFSRATLVGADLRFGDWMEADFSGADLRRADLRDANLYGADVSRVDWGAEGERAAIEGTLQHRLRVQPMREPPPAASSAAGGGR